MKTAGNSQRNYREWVEHSSLEHSSRVVLALDLEAGPAARLFQKAKKLLDETTQYFCAVRFGRHTVLNLGTGQTRRLTSRVHQTGLPCIIDDKLSDIDSTNLEIAKAYYRLGFDAIIVNPSPGWEGGLQPVFQISHQTGRGVIVLVYMSNPGATETFGQKIANGRSRNMIYQYEMYAKKAVAWKADGAVVGATRPNVIRQVKPVLERKVPIYSPGVGAQGGDLKKARRAGTDYFIIGRSIRKASDPAGTAKKYARESF